MVSFRNTLSIEKSFAGLKPSSPSSRVTDVGVACAPSACTAASALASGSWPRQRAASFQSIDAEEAVVCVRRRSLRDSSCDQGAR